MIEYFLYLFFGINFLNKKNLYLKISIKNQRRRLGEFIQYWQVKSSPGAIGLGWPRYGPDDPSMAPDGPDSPF